MSRRSRIAVVGSANVDLTTFSDRFPKAGETIFGNHFDLGWGGKGANQAVASRLCGAEVSMVARVGDDLFGPATIKNFESQGIDASHVRSVAGASSGVAPIFVESNGQNRIIVVKGANDRLLPADVDEAHTVLEAADCIVLQFEIPLETVYHTVRFARQRGIRCIVNPAPGLPVDLAALAGVDYFVPNETEAETITGMPVRSVEDAKVCAITWSTGAEARHHHAWGEGRTDRARGGCGPDRALSCRHEGHDGRGRCVRWQLCRVPRRGVVRARRHRAGEPLRGPSTTSVGTQKSFVTRPHFEDEWRARARSSYNLHRIRQP